MTLLSPPRRRRPRYNRVYVAVVIVYLAVVFGAIAAIIYFIASSGS